MKNIFENIPNDLPVEIFETLVQSGKVQIERIVSMGHTSPARGWHEQDKDEWVLLLKGAARLTFHNGNEVSMAPGDWLQIPALTKHKVVWTDPQTETVWLAVHY